MPKTDHPSAAHREVERRVLRRLRDILNRPNSLQFKLDRALRLLTAGLGTDVCSLYVNSKENFFTLVASVGLNTQALYTTKLHISEGLVGETARMQAPLYIGDAPNHPNFLFKPEVNEEALTTFMGIPLQRHERVVGVLVTQTVQPRQFEEWEVELLEMAALLLSDLVNQARKALTSPPSTDLIQDRPTMFKGRVFAPGPSAYGRVLLYQKAGPIYKPLSKLPPEKELSIFHQARGLIRQAIATRHRGAASDTPSPPLSPSNIHLRATSDAISDIPPHHRETPMDKDGRRESSDQEDIITTYLMLLDDPAWQARVECYIARGFKAAAAVLNVQQDMEYQFQQNHQESSAWIIEDLKDITQKFFFMLHNNNQIDPDILHHQDLIVVAKSLGPGEFLTLKSYNIKAIVLEGGGPNSHIALLAKSFGIPLLGWTQRITDCLTASDRLYLDTNRGVLHLNPGPALVDKLTTSTRQAETPPYDDKDRDTTALQTRHDHVSSRGFHTFLSVGLQEDVDHVTTLPSDGIGLLRSELLFLQEHEFPSMSLQEDYYSRFISAADDRRCCIRTLDIGSDKVLPYFPTQREENPALGWRSIRIGLDRTTIFRHQVRAILKASLQSGPVELLYPLIASADEFFACQKIVAEERTSLKVPTNHSIRQGAMLETPSLLFELPRLCGHVDFISVGTNDLWQFLFACDRNNPNVAFRYDRLAHAFVKFLVQLADTVKRYNIETTICGDIVTITQEIGTLAAIGFRRFSVIPSIVNATQSFLATMDLGWWENQLRAYLADPRHNSFTKFLASLEPIAN